MLLLLANATGQSKKADNDHTHKGVIVGLFHNSSTVGFAHSGSEMSIGEQLATGGCATGKVCALQSCHYQL
jgi:hypothetical protein